MADSWEDIDEQELEKNIADKIKTEQEKQKGMNWRWIRESFENIKFVDRLVLGRLDIRAIY
jgi:predicted GNAT superfamily acetyltransferase